MFVNLFASRFKTICIYIGTYGGFEKKKSYTEIYLYNTDKIPVY